MPTRNYARRSYGGIPGSAVLFGAAGLYLVYVGVKDVPFFEGLRSLLKGERPPTNNPAPFGTPQGYLEEYIAKSGSDSGTEKLVTYAKAAYPRFKSAFPNLTIYGWRSTGSVPNSDHPKGKALDIMNPSATQAAMIIFMFRGMPGAKYWIWNHNKANRTEGWKVKTYLGPNPHTDHVHLSFE